MKRPAFGRSFERRRFEGWDPAIPVLVGVRLWLQREWLDGHVLVLAGDDPPEVLDWRMLAGCAACVVHDQVDAELGEHTAIAIGALPLTTVELACWDRRQVHELLPAWRPPAALLDVVDRTAVRWFAKPRLIPAPWAAAFWFDDMQLGERCAAARLRERDARAA